MYIYTCDGGSRQNLCFIIIHIYCMGRSKTAHWCKNSTVKYSWISPLNRYYIGAVFGCCWLFSYHHFKVILNGTQYKTTKLHVNHFVTGIFCSFFFRPEMVGSFRLGKIGHFERLCSLVRKQTQPDWWGSCFQKLCEVCEIFFTGEFVVVNRTGERKIQSYNPGIHRISIEMI